MEQMPINDLPGDVKTVLKQTLDKRQSPNWRSLIKVMPKDTYNRHQVERFHMAVLKPGQSPTIELLNDLSRKRKTIGELLGWVRALAAQYPQLQPMLHRLQGGGAPEPPRISLLPYSVQRTLGSPVVLVCDAFEQQPLQYQWFKGRETLWDATKKELHIRNLEKGDEGYYICRVSNGLGYWFTDWARIDVQRLETLPSALSRPNLCVPRLLSQPPSRVVGICGGILTLYCDAVGDPAPRFQWTKDMNDLTGSTERWYIKQNISIDDQGCYNCRVYNSAGSVVSKDACVFVEKCGPPGIRGPVPLQGETCSDKVALLIGNQHYQHSDAHGVLYHPMNDVCDLAGVLTSIGFKVVSLVNLTLYEMQQALTLFYALLDEGMYALFYYAGHGFEIGNHNYLMPVEASPQYKPEESLDAWDVIQTMQAKNTKLNVILLDCCRSRPPNIDESASTANLQQAGVKEPNVVIAYGCCSQNSVFESPNRRNGFFAIHLLKHICQDKDIEQVLKEVSCGVSKEEVIDPQNQQQQLVMRVTSVAETMSLCARINPSSTCNTKGWKVAHKLPSPAEVFNADGIKVQLSFQAEFSNVLIVNARVHGDESAEACVGFEMPKSPFPVAPGPVVSVTNEEPTLQSHMRNTVGPSIRITGLQKLENIPLLRLRVKYKHMGQEKNVPIEHTMTEKPLYAKIAGVQFS